MLEDSPNYTGLPPLLKQRLEELWQKMNSPLGVHDFIDMWAQRYQRLADLFGEDPQVAQRIGFLIGLVRSLWEREEFRFLTQQDELEAWLLSCGLKPNIVRAVLVSLLYKKNANLEPRRINEYLGLWLEEMEPIWLALLKEGQAKGLSMNEWRQKNLAGIFTAWQGEIDKDFCEEIISELQLLAPDLDAESLWAAILT